MFFGFLVPDDFYLIWLSNLLNLSVSDDDYSRKRCVHEFRYLRVLKYFSINCYLRKDRNNTFTYFKYDLCSLSLHET